MFDFKDFSALKGLYESDINSTRVFDRIHDLNELILVLFDRDVLPFGDVSLITAEKLANAKLKPENSAVDLDILARWIGSDWQILAQACHVDPESCTRETAEQSAIVLLKALEKNWAGISRKEFLFRLKNYSVSCGLKNFPAETDRINLN